MIRRILIALGAVVIALQFVPVTRTNPAVTAEIQAPAEIHALLKRACYDCHSNETRWPWYARVAPVSWLVSRDVVNGRRKLNFSEWGSYTAGKQEAKIQEIREQVDKGEMPLAVYLPMHPEAKLTDADRRAIDLWAEPVEP